MKETLAEILNQSGMDWETAQKVAEEIAKEEEEGNSSNED